MSASRLYRTSSPYSGADLMDMDTEQSADTMYLAHLTHPPTKLVRTAHTNWTFSTITFAPKLLPPASLAVVVTQPNTDSANTGNAYYPSDARYCVSAIDDDTGQESRPSNVVLANNDINLKRNFNTLSWAGVSGAERYRVYKAEGTGDFGYIATTASVTFRDDNIGPDGSDGPVQGENPFPTVLDYPSTVTFYQQRLGWARTNNKPNAIYFSRSGEYENMDISRPLKASDALSFALVAGKVNAINQIVPMSDLIALTSDSVFSINGGQEGYISPTNFVVARRNGRGSSRLNPILIDDVAFHQTGVGSAIRTLGYTVQTDGYASNDMTIFSPHFFNGFGIVSWTYAAEPLSIIWAVRNDGKLLAFTWQQEHEVWGWTLCETDGTAETVCSISENGEDRVYLTIRRTINGTSRLFIERLASTLWTDPNFGCYLDCAATFNFATAQTQLINLFHLEGKTVSALADGAVYTGMIVKAGKVTLPKAAKTVLVGLPYTATMETLPLAVQTKEGWSIAKPQQASKAVVRVVNSRGFQVGPSIDKLDEPRAYTIGRLDYSPGYVTGLVEVILRPYITTGITIVVQSSTPLPLQVTEVLFDPKTAE